MAIDDNTLYGLTGAQIKELPGKIDAVKGEAKILTSADYNYPANNPNGIALWLLDAGFYKGDGSVTVYPNSYSGDRRTKDASSYLIMKLQGGSTGILCSKSNRISLAVTTNEGGTDYNVNNLLTEGVVMDNLTSTFSQFPLSANQGKVLKDSIGDLTNLTTTDKTNLVAAINEAAAGGGGGGPTVVQTTGTSQTDVMSQMATSSLVWKGGQKSSQTVTITDNQNVSYAGGNSVSIGHASLSWANDAVAIGRSQDVRATGAVAIGKGNGNSSSYGAYSVSIGSNTFSAANYSVAIGSYANDNNYSNKAGSVALGAYSNTTAVGEVNVGSTNTSYGYNSSNYRLLTGLYDPQSVHDAATKGYVDTAVAGAGASAFTTNEWNALWA